MKIKKAKVRALVARLDEIDTGLAQARITSLQLRKDLGMELTFDYTQIWQTWEWEPLDFTVSSEVRWQALKDRVHAANEWAR